MKRIVFVCLLIITMFRCSKGDVVEDRSGRHLWKKLKNHTIDRFHIDHRQFGQEEMLLFPDVAFRSMEHPQLWHAVIHGWRYQPKSNKEWLKLSAQLWIKRLADQISDPDEISNLNKSVDYDRLRPFFVTDGLNEQLTVRLANQNEIIHTDRIGQFYQQIVINSGQITEDSPRILSYEVIDADQNSWKGYIHRIEPDEGISVISDIDDTIKISEVLDKVRLFANTFIFPFKPVPGMSELYQQWLTRHPNCTFHYLSGMPDQLFTLTEEFIIQQRFPNGSFHMRHFGWAVTSLFKFLHSKSTFTHKLHYLKFFFSNTRRTFVLVGDSGEKDPEIYGTIAREYPDRIRAIFIRAIQNESFDDQRFVTAFSGVSNDKWLIFNDPKQVPIDLSQSPRKVLQ